MLIPLTGRGLLEIGSAELVQHTGLASVYLCMGVSSIPKRGWLRLLQLPSMFLYFDPGNEQEGAS